MSVAHAEVREGERVRPLTRQLDDVALAGCRRGDRAAQRALVECYQDRVYALCFALAGVGDADDLAQETFVRVFGAIGRFDGARDASLGAWVLTIARRLCVDRSRSARVRSETAAGDIERASSRPNPEEELDSARRQREIVKALEQLPDVERAAVALRAWDGLDYEEIAAIEEVPVGTIRSRLNRARTRLRELLTSAKEWRHALDE